MLANKAPSRARRMAGAGFVALTLLGAGFAAWAQKPPVPAIAGIVSIDKEGHVNWNGKAAENRDAMMAAANAQVASGVFSIQLNVDAKTQYMKVEPAIRRAQQSGMKDITFMPSGIVFETPMPPPPNQPPPLKDLPDPVRVFVDFDGGIYYNGVLAYYNGKPAGDASLDQNFQRDASLKVQPEIHIEPHRQAPFESVVKVLAAMKKAGLTKSALVGGGPPDDKGQMIMGLIK